MRPISSVRSALLIGCVAIAGFSVIYPFVTIAQTTQLQPKWSWDDLWAQLRRKKPPLISRGELCAIAPSMAGATQVVWNLKPLFVWNGGVGRIEVHPQGNKTVLWRYLPSPMERNVLYAGKPLQPGQTYDWFIFDPLAKDAPKPTKKVQFQIMDTSDHQQIVAQLHTLETRLKAKGTDAEHIALQRANFFKEQDLWSDALQEVLLVNHPSAELKAIVQQIPQVCSSD